MRDCRLTKQPKCRLSGIKRAAAVAVAILSAGLLAACGGGGGGSSPLGVTPNVPQSGGAVSRPVGQATTAPTATPTITTSGSIVGLFAGGFTLDSGSPHGRINVYVSASTQIVGETPAVGESVSVNATGSWSTSLQAIWVTQAGLPTPSPTPVPTATPLPTPAATPTAQATYVPTITTSGSVVSLFAAGFTLDSGSPHGKINVYTPAATVFYGTKPYVGESVSVNATGSWSSSLTAVWVTQAGYATPTPVAAPTPSATATPVPITNVPNHIPTWAFDEYWSNGANASSSNVRTYVTYAEGGLGNSKAQQDCATSPKSCHSVAYLNPNLQYNNALCPAQPDAQFISAASESWFVHQPGYTDSGHRAAGSYSSACNGTSESVPVYLADQANASVQAWYKSYIQQNLDNWDYYWLDATSTTVAGQAFGPGGSFCPGQSSCSTTQEYPTDASVLAAHISFADSMAHVNGSPLQFFFNGLSFNAGNVQNTSLLSQDPNHFLGGVCENCIVNNGALQTANYSQVLNAMLQVNGIAGASFVELDTGSSPTGSAAQIMQRTVALAIAWLGYADGHTIIFPNFEYSTQSLGVWPEDMIYPGGAVQSMQWSANDIQVSGNVWRREFQQCFNNKQPIGPCASIVNGSTSTVTVSSAWLKQTYNHQIVLQGGDVITGGSVSTNSAAFTPNVTTIAPGQALLLAQ